MDGQMTESWQGKNSKLQTPSFRETPKLQALSLWLVDSLVLGAWSLKLSCCVVHHLFAGFRLWILDCSVVASLREQSLDWIIGRAGFHKPAGCPQQPPGANHGRFGHRPRPERSD